MTCEVCNKDVKTCLGASRFGPCSFLACADCVVHHAEPIWAFDYIKDQLGSDPLAYNPPILKVTTWDGTKYITLEDWLQCPREPVSTSGAT